MNTAIDIFFFFATGAGLALLWVMA